MPRKPNLPRDDPEQSKRFIDMARELEADESPDALDRAFERVIQPKPPSHSSMASRKASMKLPVSKK